MRDRLWRFVDRTLEAVGVVVALAWIEVDEWARERARARGERANRAFLAKIDSDQPMTSVVGGKVIDWKPFLRKMRREGQI